MFLRQISLVTLVLSVAACSNGQRDATIASGYPAGYCDQSTTVISDGPALYARVGSGCMGGEVIGYRKSGILAQSNPEKVVAVVVGSCALKNGQIAVKNSSVELGREWNGLGYTSAEMNSSSFFDGRCFSPDSVDYGATKKIALAFTANGQWDSANNRNFVNIESSYPQNTFTGRREVMNTIDKDATISRGIWNFIIDQMRK